MLTSEFFIWCSPVKSRGGSLDGCRSSWSLVAGDISLFLNMTCLPLCSKNSVLHTTNAFSNLTEFCPHRAIVVNLQEQPDAM